MCRGRRQNLGHHHHHLRTAVNKGFQLAQISHQCSGMHKREPAGRPESRAQRLHLNAFAFISASRHLLALGIAAAGAVLESGILYWP